MEATIRIETTMLIGGALLNRASSGDHCVVWDHLLLLIGLFEDKNIKKYWQCYKKKRSESLNLQIPYELLLETLTIYEAIHYHTRT